MIRRRRYLDSHWHHVLNSLMLDVLKNPQRYHRSIIVWAEWRRRWLATREAHPEGTSNLYDLTAETAARHKF